MRFSDSLDRRLEEIKRPPNLPVGNYIWQITRHPDIDEFSAKDGTVYERLTFTVTCVAPSDDVDTDELEEYGNVTGTSSRISFLFTTDEDERVKREQSEFRLRQFLSHLGLPEDLLLKESLSESIHKQFLGQVSHRPDPNDPEIIYQEINRTAAV